MCPGYGKCIARHIEQIDRFTGCINKPPCLKGWVVRGVRRTVVGLAVTRQRIHHDLQIPSWDKTVPTMIPLLPTILDPVFMVKDFVKLPFRGVICL